MTVMLTHGWPLCMFQVSSRHVIVSDSIESSVRLSPCEQDQEEGVRSGFEVATCAQSSVAVRITPPRFSSPLCTDAVAAAASAAAPLLLLPTSPSPPQPYPAIDPHRHSGIIATKA